MNKDKWIVPRGTIGGQYILDPRVAMAKHIGWTRPFSHETEYTIPEPDNFNYAVLNPVPVECPCIQNQVFFKDTRSKLWWSVYFVPPELEQEFLTWADDKEFKLRFCPHRYAKVRKFRPFLWTKKAAAEQTLPERLYKMGYFDKLQNKFDVDFRTRIGDPRPNMPEGEFT